MVHKLPFVPICCAPPSSFSTKLLIDRKRRKYRERNGGKGREGEGEKRSKGKGRERGRRGFIILFSELAIEILIYCLIQKIFIHFAEWLFLLDLDSHFIVLFVD